MTPGCGGSGSRRGPLAVAFDESYAAVLQAKARWDALDQAIAELAAERRSPRSSGGSAACAVSPP
jgi:hypothetical protein